MEPKITLVYASLPPATEVWGKVIISQMSVCPQEGGGLPDRDIPGFSEFIDGVS